MGLVLYQESQPAERDKVPCLKWTLNRGEMAIVPAMMYRFVDSEPFSFWLNAKKCLMGAVYTREYLGKPATGFCIKKLYLKMGFENARGAFNFPDLNGLYGVGMANKTDLTNSTYYDKTNEQLLTEFENHISTATATPGDTPLSDVPFTIYCVVDNDRLYMVIQEFPLSYSTPFVETASNQRYIGYMGGEDGVELHIPLTYVTASTVTIDIPPEYENTDIVSPTVVLAAPPVYASSSANKVSYNYRMEA